MSQYGKSFAQWYDLMYSWKDYASESEKLFALIEKHGNGGKRVLEVACGTGKYIEHFAKKFDVTGVDLSAEMVGTAKQKFPSIKFVQGNMMDFRLDEKFDVVMCLFSSIAYLRNDDEMRKALKNFYDHLNAEGIAIIEGFVDPDRYQAGHIGVLNTEMPGAKLSRHNVTKLEGDMCRMEMHTLVSTEAGTEYFVESHDMTLFSIDRMTGLIEQTDFTCQRIDSGLMTNRSLYLCRKQSARMHRIKPNYF